MSSCSTTQGTTVTTHEFFKYLSLTFFIFAVVAFILRGHYANKFESNLFRGTITAMIMFKKALFWDTIFFKILIPISGITAIISWYLKGLS